MLCACSYWNPFKLAWKMKRRKKTEKSRRIDTINQLPTSWIECANECTLAADNERSKVRASERTNKHTHAHLEYYCCARKQQLHYKL